MGCRGLIARFPSRGSTEEGLAMNKVYADAVNAIERVAEDEERKQRKPLMLVTFDFNVALEVLGSLAILIGVKEERINNDLRRDHRLPNDYERRSLTALRAAQDAMVMAIKRTPDVGLEVKSE
jgi:hypothetical protein